MQNCQLFIFIFLAKLLAASMSTNQPTNRLSPHIAFQFEINLLINNAFTMLSKKLQSQAITAPRLLCACTKQYMHFCTCNPSSRETLRSVMSGRLSIRVAILKASCANLKMWDEEWMFFWMDSRTVSSLRLSPKKGCRFRTEIVSLPVHKSATIEDTTRIAQECVWKRMGGSGAVHTAAIRLQKSTDSVFRFDWFGIWHGSILDPSPFRSLGILMHMVNQPQFIPV